MLPASREKEAKFSFMIGPLERITNGDRESPFAIDGSKLSQTDYLGSIGLFSLTPVLYVITGRQWQNYFI